MPATRLLAGLLVVGLALVGCSGDDDDAAGDDDRTTTTEDGTTTTAPSTSADVATVFEPLEAASTELPDRVDAWLDGTVELNDLRRDARVLLVAASEALEVAEALPEGDESRPLLAAAAALYSEQATSVLEAANREPSPARDQILLLAQRLGVLADRVHGWARWVADPDEADDPEPVPEWSAMGLVAGPPLDEAPPPTDVELVPPLERPSQPEDDWRDAVEAAGAPEAIDELAELAPQARAYVDAASAMRDEPDPDGDDGHLVSARLRLGWLIKADAVRAAQLELPEVAGGLAAVSLTGEDAAPEPTEA